MTKDGAPIDDVVEDTWLGSATNNSGGGNENDRQDRKGC